MIVVVLFELLFCVIIVVVGFMSVERCRVGVCLLVGCSHSSWATAA